MVNGIRSTLQLCLCSYLFEEYTEDLKNDIILNITNNLYKYTEIYNISVDIVDEIVNNVPQLTVSVKFALKKDNTIHRIVISTESMN